VEGWSWLDSYFFTVVTLSTVGYGELVPQTAVGRIGTTVFILVGLGIFAVAVQQFGQYAMRKREEHTEWLIARLGTSEEPPANDDDPPDCLPDAALDVPQDDPNRSRPAAPLQGGSSGP
jgi:voltage-gated potassium channel